MDTLFGFMIGLLAGVVLMFIVIETSPNILRTWDTIIYKKDDNLVCRIDEDYPKINCELIEKAIGPKKIETKEIEVEIG